jgi:NAD(P)-dependent dehydrogenase (short-subunit alcohol dehydrogenase family)
MIAADVTDPATPGRAVNLILDRYGRLDGLVNGMGGLQSTAGFPEISEKRWESTFDLNPHAAVRMSRAALSALLRGGGSIVHLASEAARFPVSSILEYSVAKTAMLTLSEGLAVEFGPRGVRSNVVHQDRPERACGTIRAVFSSYSRCPSRKPSNISCERSGDCRPAGWARPRRSLG